MTVILDLPLACMHQGSLDVLFAAKFGGLLYPSHVPLTATYLQMNFLVPLLACARQGNTAVLFAAKFGWLDLLEAWLGQLSVR